MKVLFAYRQRSAVCYYRSILPGRALKALGHEIDLVDYSQGLAGADPSAWVKSLARDYDVIVTDRAYDDYRHLGFLAGLRHVNPESRMIVDFDDDFTSVPHWNQSYNAYQPGQLSRKIGEGHLKLAEMATVTTKRLADKFRAKVHAVRVAPNHIDPKEFANHPVNPERTNDPHLRVLYGGAAGHFGDLDEVRAGVEAALRKQHTPFRLICLGSAPFWMHELHREQPGKMVLLPWVKDFIAYPVVVAWGGFEVAMAPLAQHAFNESKSNIKWLEATLQGMTFLCSDVGPYADLPDDVAVKVSNTPLQWSEALRAVLADPDLRAQKVARAREAIGDHFSLARLGVLWEEILADVLDCPRIESLEGTKLPSDPRPAAPDRPDTQEGPPATTAP
jgi:hypothetical protein